MYRPLALAMIAAACRPDPCADALRVDALDEGVGPAAIRVEIVEQRGRPGYPSRPLDCFGMTVLTHDAYEDTLHASFVAPAGRSVSVTGLEDGVADLIVDRPGYFPVKIVDVPLTERGLDAPMKVYMYPRDVPFVYPGELIVALKPGVPFETIEPTVRGLGGVDIQATPEPGYFQLRYPVGDLRQFRGAAERLTRRLLASPHVREAGPATSMTLLTPALQ